MAFQDISYGIDFRETPKISFQFDIFQLSIKYVQKYNDKEGVQNLQRDNTTYLTIGICKKIRNSKS